jgi:hypothetical protein
MGTKYFKNIPMPCRNDVENILPHVHGWKSQNGWKKDEKKDEKRMKIEHRWAF